MDSYRNLTMKKIATLNWYLHHCDHAKIMATIDDDAYLDLPLLLVKLNQMKLSTINYLLCVYYAGGYLDTLIRDPRHYHYVPEEIHRSGQLPHYCYGLFQVYSRLAAQLIVVESLTSLPALYLEDVFLTGFMGEQANVIRYQINRHFIEWHCDRVANDVVDKVVIGDNCSPQQLAKIYRVKHKH